MAASIRLDRVSKAFREHENIVSDFNLEICAGEFVSFLGPSGCGKSTLLRLIAGLENVSSGEITVSHHGASGALRRGFVFQEPALLPWKTVLGNTSLPLELSGVPATLAKERAVEVLSMVGLNRAIEKYPNQLSGGMKMRVSVARALVGEPDLLLLDEPFAALDENTRYRLQEELRVLWERLRMTVIFVTHSVSEAVFLSTRTVVLSDRPARVILDRNLQLPEPRIAALRTSEEFMREMSPIYQSFHLEHASAT